METLSKEKVRGEESQQVYLLMKIKKGTNTNWVLLYAILVMLLAIVITGHMREKDELALSKAQIQYQDAKDKLNTARHEQIQALLKSLETRLDNLSATCEKPNAP